VSFDEEWRRIQADAAARRTVTRLNQLDGDGGGTAELSVRADDLGLVGNDAFELRERLNKDGRHAQTSTPEAAAAAGAGAAAILIPLAVETTEGAVNKTGQVIGDGTETKQQRRHPAAEERDLPDRGTQRERAGADAHGTARHRYPE